MAEEELQRRILFVGNGITFEDYQDIYARELANFSCKIEVAKWVRDVSQAAEQIDTNKYHGILLESLVLPLGKDYKKHTTAVSEFYRFDNDGQTYYSGGLYIVKHSKEKGLVCVTRGLAEPDEVLKEAKRLGAKVIPRRENRPIMSSLSAFRESFGQK